LQNMPSPDELDALYQVFKAIVTHPAFQSTVAAIRSTTASEGSQAVSTQLPQDALVAEGVPIPDGYTITTTVLPDFSVSNTGQPSSVALEGGQPQPFCFQLLGIQICLVHLPPIDPQR